MTVTAPARNEARNEAGHDRAPEHAPVNPRTVRLSLVAAALALGAVVGCNDDSPETNASPIINSATTVSPTPSATGEQAAILDQYRLFWSSLPRVSRMPAEARRGALEKFTIDPELKSLLAGMSKLDGQGRVLYGVNKPRPVASVSADGRTAVVDDCQDSSRAGAADRSTMHPVTVGVARNHVVVTMKKPRGAWMVSFVSYSKTPC